MWLKGSLGSRAARRPGLLVPLVALAACACAPPGPDVAVLVTVDTLRADRLGAYGSELGLTPHLDALAAESLVFDAAYAPASFTLPAMTAAFTGRHPIELGIRSNESALDASFPTLAGELRARGWRTVAVVGNYVLRAECGLAAGFDVYDDTFPEREAVRGWPERSAGATTDAALARLDACLAEVAESRERCFLWVHYQDPHGPYTPPEGLREKHLPRARRAHGDRELAVREDDLGVGGLPRYQVLEDRRDAAFYAAGYDAEVEYTDREVGRLLRGLEARGLAERAVVAFAADHGEGLGERDYWFAHGEHLTDPLVRVPLFLRASGVAPARRADPAGLVDLAPTLASLLAREPVALGTRGRDLLAPEAADAEPALLLATLAGATHPRFALLEGGFKFIASHREGIYEGELYRRGEEERDLSVAAPHVARRMRLAIESRLEAIPERPESRQDLSAEEREALRALGYASDEDE